MQKKKTGSPAYLEALKNLTHIINTEYKNGGKLPGAIEMCKRLDVCMVTYIKILKILCQEGLLTASKGRGGTCVRPMKERRCKIGIVIRNAEDSPFLGEIPLMTAAFGKLNEEHLVLHLLQAAKVENVYDKALFHAVSGLMWFAPDERAIPVIEKIQKETEIPILILDMWTRGPRRSAEERSINCVIQDSEEEYNAIAEYAKQRTHRSVLRVDHYDELFSGRLIDAFVRKGIAMTPEHYLQPGSIEKQLRNKLRELRPTLIISEGGFMIYKQICDILSTLPKKNRPELLIRNAGNLPAEGMKNLYPGVRITGKMVNDFELVGREAAIAMVEHLRDNIPLGQKKVKCFSIQPL